MDGPLLDPQCSLSKAIAFLDIVTTFIFTIEALLKIVALGFLFNGR
jgi:hypothetical protein